MSLKTTILQYALPLLPKYSFTRDTLSLALQQIRSVEQPLAPSRAVSRDFAHTSQLDSIGRENIIDTLFGTGTTSPAKALVESWQVEGLKSVDSGHDRASLTERLERRLEYSSGVGEHLVEAYALLSAPGSTPSVPVPRSVLDHLPRFDFPPLYQPPGTASTSSHARLDPPATSRVGAASEWDSITLLDKLESLTGGRIPFLRFNPLGPLGYAWDIADHALRIDETRSGQTRGMMNEPTGAGPEWYTSRMSIALAYLAAESQLLQPQASHPVAIEDAAHHLSAAKRALRTHLKRYDGAREIVQSSESGLKDVGSMLEFFGRGMIGLLRSRGL
ncbi:hypothetical protein BD324DRAFT_639285 [Kockovaella imperatae]|uniref:COQ9 domain-containing protein n=1 Tax=Kockovaella imperatae TaxID=4999 RepID=A0A1Y1U6A1_9TREE|nr:hypothetical protein BD324DRAFT_639285 [Kockovaella imperatae]ORX33559.1 hypothetical protein BD324DRAFT_639285 [Kockovaella imperatae]